MILKDKPPMKMLVSPEHIQFVTDEHITGIGRSLVLFKKDLSFCQDLQPTNENTQIIPIYALFGVLAIFGRNYLFYVQQAKPIVLFNKIVVYEIETVLSIPIDKITQTLAPIEQETLLQVEKYLSRCTYFAYKYDLTLPLNQQQQNGALDRSVRFWWNFNALKMLMSKGLNQEWCIRIIQGYVGHQQTLLKSCNQIQYTLISRREWQRGGTRYNHRGIDQNGNAANCVETEQIVSYQSTQYSHLQVRGSVPIFWQQTGIRAVSELTQNHEQTMIGFKKHFDLQQKLYGKVLCVNLMSRDKINEQILNTNYQQFHQQSKIKDLAYEYIDFHSVCKNYKFENLNPIIEYHAFQLRDYQFTKIDMGKVIQVQKGIVRTNCLDCLDRTNVFMNKIAIQVIQYILRDAGINLIEEFNCEQLLKLSELQHEKCELIKLVKILWGDSGDCISKLYAGTKATTTAMSKNGGNGWTGMFQHGIKGIERFYRQNFEDKDKQDIYNLVVGYHTHSHQEVQGLVNQIEAQMQIQQTQATVLSIMVIGLDMKQLQSHDVLFPQLFDHRKNPELVVLCIQNVNTQLIQFGFIKELLLDSLKIKQGTYELITWSQTPFHYTFVFGKSKIVQNVEKSLNEVLKYQEQIIGLQTVLEYQQFTFIFLNLNINVEQFSDFAMILEERINRFDLGFICGIKNSKILTNSVIQPDPLDRLNAISKLYQKDQLCKLLITSDFLRDQFQEPIIEFMPDQSNNWNERILYGSQSALEYIKEQYYEEVKFKRVKSIRLGVELDLKQVELCRKQASIEMDDNSEFLFSSVFFNTPQGKDTDDFDVIQ